MFSLTLYNLLLTARKKGLGAEYSNTVTSMVNLASMYFNQERGKDAEELFIQVLETRKKVQDIEHLDTVTSMVNPASMYRKQG